LNNSIANNQIMHPDPLASPYFITTKPTKKEAKILASLFDKIQNGVILSSDEMLIFENYMRRKQRHNKAKALHPYKIHYTEKSGYFTVVDDVTAPDGKRKIRRVDEESLLDELADLYLVKLNIKLNGIFEEWLEWKETPQNGDNIKRIKASWKAYYENEKLSVELLDTPITQITSLMLLKWAESLLRKHYPVDMKKFSRIFTIVNQCFEFACDYVELVPVNMWKKARKKLNKSLIVSSTPVADDNEQIFTDDERRQIKAMVYEDMGRYAKQATVAGLQILFLFETGLRIAECCGLKFSDIKDKRLYIRRQANNDGVKEWVKTSSGYRDIPLTDEALRILDDVRDYNKKHGFKAEWIFQSNNPNYDYRLSYNAADHKLRKLCNRLGTPIKSPHKCRKTCISALLDSPHINERTVQRYAGHRSITTSLNYYSYERKTKEEQVEAINLALSI